MKADWTNEDLDDYAGGWRSLRAGVPFMFFYGRDANTPLIQLPVVLGVRRSCCGRRPDQIGAQLPAVSPFRKDGYPHEPPLT